MEWKEPPLKYPTRKTRHIGSDGPHKHDFYVVYLNGLYATDAPTRRQASRKARRLRRQNRRDTVNVVARDSRSDAFARSEPNDPLAELCKEWGRWERQVHRGRPTA